MCQMFSAPGEAEEGPLGGRGQHKRRLGLGVRDSTVHLENSELQLDWSMKWGREVSKDGTRKIVYQEKTCHGLCL